MSEYWGFNFDSLGYFCHFSSFGHIHGHNRFNSTALSPFFTSCAQQGSPMGTWLPTGHGGNERVCEERGGRWGALRGAEGMGSEEESIGEGRRRKRRRMKRNRNEDTEEGREQERIKGRWTEIMTETNPKLFYSFSVEHIMIIMPVRESSKTDQHF